ncbi:hypothetical protein Gpo141_00000920 [Globisporangium polare]
MHSLSSHETSSSSAISASDELDFLNQQQARVEQQQLSQQHQSLLLDGPPHDDDGDDDDQSDWTFMKADAFALQSPLSNNKRSAWSRRLVVTKQPASEFYKDEGGKSNALDVEVTLVEFNELGEPARSPDDEFVDIPLRILLFFESGKRVDDTDQEIFRFVGNDYDSVVIRGHSRKASVQFRLEKVSRRKDGQRFKLRIGVDQEQCTANVSDLTPIFTNAICVLSKRKHHSTYLSDSSARAKESAPKLAKRDLVRLEEKLSSKIDAVLAEMNRMNRHIQKQNELIARLCLPIPATATLSNSCDSASLEWLLKTSLGDDRAHHPSPAKAVIYHHQQTQQSHQQQQQTQASLDAYLTSSDDSYETETQFSPSSSDMSVVEILPSTLTFAEF